MRTMFNLYLLYRRRVGLSCIKSVKHAIGAYFIHGM